MTPSQKGIDRNRRPNDEQRNTETLRCPEKEVMKEIGM